MSLKCYEIRFSRGEWDLQGSGWGASVHYRDLVGQIWQLIIRSDNPRLVAVTGRCVDEVGRENQDFSWTTESASQLMHSLTHTHTHTRLLHKHSEPSLAVQSSSAHWFWLGGNIIGFHGGNDRLWLQGFGSESSSEAGEWDRLQHHVCLPLKSYAAKLGCYVGLMHYKSNMSR